MTIAAGAYEFTPLKRQFRRRCRETAGAGFGFGLCCMGSSAGLMAMLVVLGVMSIGWMAAIAAVVTPRSSYPHGPASMCRSLSRSLYGGSDHRGPFIGSGLTPPR